MSDYIPTSQPPIPRVEGIEDLRGKYRCALLSVGKSPDYHIFDLSSEFINGLKDSKAKRYLYVLKQYFASLPIQDQKIFVYDVLEAGRHYPFWYLENYTRRTYESRLRQLVAEVPPCLRR